MFVLRLIAILTAISIGAGILAYLFTGDRRYLGISWRITRFAILFALVLLSLMVLERVAGMA